MKQVTITRRARFNAAHRLWNDAWDVEKNFEVFGKCANPNWHGHNYEVFVTVRGEIDEATGYFINFSDLKAIIKDKVEAAGPQEPQFGCSVDAGKTNLRREFGHRNLGTT